MTKPQTIWSINLIEEAGFKLITNHKLWCHFRGHGFDVTINLDTRVVKGNHFNFHSYKSNFKGNFSATLNTKEELLFLLRIIN